MPRGQRAAPPGVVPSMHCSKPRVPSDLASVMPTWAPGESIATRVASGDVPRRVARRRTVSCRRRRGPHGQHRHRRQEARHDVGRRTRRTPDPLRNPRARHGWRDDRHGAARWRHSRRRHVPRVQRLHAWLGTPGGDLAGARVIYSWTHDSVGVGEDGPTHQPIEHIAALRAMPGLRVVRPADANETASAWRMALVHDGPTALILSRQNLTVLDGTGRPDTIERGAYILDSDADPAAGAHRHRQRGLGVCDGGGTAAPIGRAASAWCPCRAGTCSKSRSESYRASVLPASLPALAVEAACSFGWDRYADATVVHRPLRCVRPGRCSCSTNWASTPRTSCGATLDNVAQRSSRPSARDRPASSPTSVRSAP